VAGDDAGAPRSRPHDRIERGDGRRVEVGQRLVEQQQLGLVQDRPAHRRALHHPARQRAHGVIGAGAEPHLLEQLAHAALRHSVQPAVVAQVLARGQVAIEQRIVAQQPDPPPDRPGVARQLAAE